MRTDRASRLIRAPIDQVYAAFITSDLLVRWLPPEGMTGNVVTFDPVAGGSYKIALSDADDTEAVEHGDAIEAKFIKLIRNHSIQLEVAFDADEAEFSGVVSVRWAFEREDDAASTRVQIACANVPGGIRKQDHVAALKGSLARLAKLVEPAA